MSRPLTFNSLSAISLSAMTTRYKRRVLPMGMGDFETQIMRIYLFICLANFTCTGEYVRCGGSSPRPLCINQLSICDGHEDCSNGWDEDAETCGQFVYWLIHFVLLSFSKSHSIVQKI